MYVCMYVFMYVWVDACIHVFIFFAIIKKSKYKDLQYLLKWEKNNIIHK